MEKKVTTILVPKDKCPLDILAEMGERTKESWIFLHENAIKNLKNNDGVEIQELQEKGLLCFSWEATEDYPETQLIVDIHNRAKKWKEVSLILASDIAFNIISDDPDEIIFLKMEE